MPKVLHFCYCCMQRCKLRHCFPCCFYIQVLTTGFSVVMGLFAKVGGCLSSSLLMLPSDFVVLADTELELDYAQKIARSIGCEAILRSAASGSAPMCLAVTGSGVVLEQNGKRAPGPIKVDFASGAAEHRRKFGGGKGQLIAKAVGLKGTFLPRVVDMTAGLGGDAFVLASLGCQVHMLERSPVVYALLHDGLVRAESVQQAEEINDPVESLSAIAARLSSERTDALAWMERCTENQRPDVIYFDPMFPERKKAAQVNKSMQAFHALVGQDLDAGEVLHNALQTAIYRVVVKRPRLAVDVAGDPRFPALGLPAPSHQVVGKTSRYDVYTVKKLPLN